MADQQKFIIEALNKHNEFRKRHGVNELVHNQDLSKQALAWASILAEKNQIVYSNTETAKERFGENIAMVYSYDTYDGGHASEKWYNEIYFYDFNAPGLYVDTEHFTQLVWKNTHQVGFGIAKSSDNAIFAVAHYYPAGNSSNEFEENVLPPKA